VLSVGGTTLTLDDSNQVVSETGWSQSGGGVSSYEPQPTYQATLPQPYPMRTVPDVAYNADMVSAYYVYDSDPIYGGTQAVYGTSAGAPQWAALIALADEGLANNNIGSLDGATQTIQALYTLANASYSTYFNDIQIGNNGFPAGQGYDLVTGLGTPIAAQLVPGIVSSFQSPGGNARRPQGFDLNPLADSNVTGTTVSPVHAPRLATPGHPGTSQKAPGMQGGFANEPLVLLLAGLANTAPGTGPLAVATLSATNPGLHAGMEANTPIPLAFPPLTSSSRFSESRIESGGGDNGLLVDDSGDVGPVENALPSVPDETPGLAFLSFPPQLGSNCDVSTSGPQMTASCFFAEQPNVIAGSRQAALSSATEPRAVLPDPLAAAGALALALGGYWVKPAREARTVQRQFELC
jgi:hypothetical protein